MRAGTQLLSPLNGPLHSPRNALQGQVAIFARVSDQVHEEGRICKFVDEGVLMRTVTGAVPGFGKIGAVRRMKRLGGLAPKLWIVTRS